MEEGRNATYNITAVSLCSDHAMGVKYIIVIIIIAPQVMEVQSQTLAPSINDTNKVIYHIIMVKRLAIIICKGVP